MKPLSSLSNDQLASRLESIRKQERLSTLDLIACLVEMERRELHLRLGYSSLFDYCTRRLGYSESGAARRVRVARCVRRFPEVLDMLRRGEVNVVIVAMVAGVLTDENREALLTAVRGRSQNETEAILAMWRPGGKPVRDRIRPIRVARPPIALALTDRPGDGSSYHSGGRKLAAVAGSTQAGAPQNGSDSTVVSGAGAGTRADAPAPSTTCAGPTTERHYEFKFGADESFMGMFQEVKRLMAGRDPRHMDIAGVIRVLMEEYIQRHSPRKKAERRAARQNHRPAAMNAPAQPLARSRHIPVRVREAVMERDRRRCTFIAPDGTRCAATSGLQIDHIVPFARGGDNTPGNLRVLCAEHNRLEAKSTFGAPFVERKTRGRNKRGLQAGSPPPRQRPLPEAPGAAK